MMGTPLKISVDVAMGIAFGIPSAIVFDTSVVAICIIVVVTPVVSLIVVVVVPFFVVVVVAIIVVVVVVVNLAVVVLTTDVVVTGTAIVVFVVLVATTFAVDRGSFAADEEPDALKFPVCKAAASRLPSCVPTSLPPTAGGMPTRAVAFVGVRRISASSLRHFGPNSNAMCLATWMAPNCDSVSFT